MLVGPSLKRTRIQQLPPVRIVHTLKARTRWWSSFCKQLYVTLLYSSTLRTPGFGMWCGTLRLWGTFCSFSVLHWKSINVSLKMVLTAVLKHHYFSIFFSARRKIFGKERLQNFRVFLPMLYCRWWSMSRSCIWNWWAMLQWLLGWDAQARKQHFLKRRGAAGQYHEKVLKPHHRLGVPERRLTKARYGCKAKWYF